MLLAIRPVVLEPYLGGLDKMYRLHKWLGISGLVISLSHWLMAQVPKWLVGWGLLERPLRPPRPALAADSIQHFFTNQRHLAESIGEWAFYGALLLMVLALVQRFPYRWFFKTHRLLAVTYLALAWHSVVLMKFNYWSGVLGPVMAVLMAAFLTAKSPPKPQQSSAPLKSTTSASWTRSSSARGCASMPNSRSRWQQAW